MAFASAVAALRARGVTVFASSMNDASRDAMGAPACVQAVVAVGAVYDAAVGPVRFGTVCSDASTAADMIACFSNGGSALDLLAPGAWIMSTGLGGGISTFGGTSQASPHAAAAAALLLQAHPALTPDRVEASLEGGGVPIQDPRTGLMFPRLSVPGALALASRPAVSDARVAPAQLGFGRTRVGRTRTRVLTLSNVGTAPLRLSAARTGRPFGVGSPLPVTVPPGSRAQLRVRFTPPRARVYRASLTLTVDDPDTPRLSVPLSGTGTRR
jgi:subtilisin family serine protease